MDSSTTLCHAQPQQAAFNGFPVCDLRLKIEILNMLFHGLVKNKAAIKPQRTLFLDMKHCSYGMQSSTPHFGSEKVSWNTSKHEFAKAQGLLMHRLLRVRLDFLVEVLCGMLLFSEPFRWQLG